MKKNAVDKQIEEALKTDTGTFIYAVKSMIAFLEDEDSPEADKQEALVSLRDSLGRISERTHRNDFLEENDETGAMMELFTELPTENQTQIIYALEMFSRTVRKAAESTPNGKKRETQIFILNRLLSVMKTISFCYTKVESDKTRWEAFGRIIEMEDNYLKSAQRHGEETERRAALLDGIRAKFGTADRTKEFNETMGRLYIGLDEKAKSFFYWELLGFGLHDLKCELKELEDEYAGIEMDFSKYMERIAALCQLKIIIRKLNPPEPADEEDSEENPAGN